MKVSHKWLQTYFKKEIPKPKELGELFTFHSFEVEGIEGDIIDIKILPDRAHYCLSHNGIAEEVRILTGLEYINPRLIGGKALVVPKSETISQNLSIKITDPAFCSRYVGRIVEKVTVGDSPAWLKSAIESIGGRSINNIVDATNFVMFDIGQPLHAFDANKVKGGIIVRPANDGEMITTLDGKEVKLTPEDSVVADDEGPLAIAGVKGGKRAEVGPMTTRIIIEAANFNPSSVRKTSTRVGIRNDSSKRFENGIAITRALEGMELVSGLITRDDMSPKAVFGEMVDTNSTVPSPKTIATTTEYIAHSLGVKISKEEIVKLLALQGIAAEGDLKLTIPLHRLDLTIPQDIVEEVGRLYGYDKVPEVIPAVPTAAPRPHPAFYVSEKIKNILVAEDFSEVMLYTLVAKGDIETAYPLASDKSALRTSLVPGLLKCLEMNARNADLLGLETIKIFEIGRTFTKDKKTGEVTESLKLGIGVAQIKKVKGVTSEKVAWEALENLGKELKFSAPKGQAASAGNFAALEIDVDSIVSTVSIPDTFADLGFGPAKDVVYKSFSQYPFIVRDIAVFVNGEATDDLREDVWRTIWQGVVDAGAEKIIARHALFDVFSKKAEDGSVKTSYAYRLLLQATDRTLTDEEANGLMQKIYTRIAEKGWEVR